MSAKDDFSLSPHISKDDVALHKIRESFKSIAPNTPNTVVDSWVRACVHTGINPLYVCTENSSTHIPILFVMQFEEQKEEANIFGSTIDSAIIATALILYRLKTTPNHEGSISKYAKREILFYNTFIGILCEHTAKFNLS